MAQQHIMEAGPQHVPKFQTHNLVRGFMCVNDWPKGPNIIPRPNLGDNSISPQPHSDLPSSYPISLAVPRSVFVMPPTFLFTISVSLVVPKSIFDVPDLPPCHAQSPSPCPDQSSSCLNLPHHAPICLRHAPIFLIYVQFSPDLPSSIASPPRSAASKFRLKPNSPHPTTNSI